jgi:hypothetical protein
MNNQIGKQELFHPDLGQPDTAPNQELDQNAKSLAPIVEELKSLSDKTDDNETASQKLALLQRANAKLDELLKKPGSNPEVIDLEKFDEKVMDFLDRTHEMTVESLAFGLTGLESDRSWQERQRLLANNQIKDPLIKSLAGLDSDQAWNMRDQFLVEPFDHLQIEAFVASLAGLDSDRAWRFRDNATLNSMIVVGLVGLDSDRAWTMREKAISEKIGLGWVAWSLAGLDSDRAWALREKMSKKGIGEAYLKRSLVGLDSDRAWKLREKFFQEGVVESGDYSTFADLFASIEERWNPFAQSLAGLDSDRAWEMRERMEEAGLSEGDILISLAGVNSEKAWDFREEMLKKGVYREELALSLSGNKTTFVWRLIAKRKQEEAKKKKQPTTI